jgi:hypothetical protein
MPGERRLRAVQDVDPIWRLWEQLPPEWRGPVIGPGIDNWQEISPTNRAQRLTLTGLPDVIAAEMAWMAHWQAQDGTQPSVLALSQLANVLRLAIQERHPFPPSIRAMDWPTASTLQGWFYATRWRRLPPNYIRAQLRIVFGLARTALLAPVPRWPLVGVGRVVPAVRSTHSFVFAGAASQPRLLTGTAHRPVAARGGEVASGHDAGVRRPALEHDQPKAPAVPAPIR